MGNTGLKAEESDLKEDLGCQSSHNNYLKPLDCTTGDIYYLLVQNITETSGFTIEFGGTASFVASQQEFSCLFQWRAYTITTIDDDFCSYTLSAITPIENNIAGLTVYPNPTLDIINWKYDIQEKTDEVYIIDLQGRILRHIKRPL